MTAALSPVQLAQALGGAKREGKGWCCLCPAHDDHTPSLSIVENDGKILLTCRAGCEQDAVIDALRRRALWHPKSNGVDARSGANGTDRIVARYDYGDETGKVLFQVCRTADKDFPQRRPDGNGGWIWRLGNTDGCYIACLR
jgi:putative DNA primase/helicase